MQCRTNLRYLLAGGYTLGTKSVTPPVFKDDIVIDFGGIGLWVRMNDASWLKLHNGSREQVVVGDMDGNGADDVIAAFSSGIFVKRNLGAWVKLHNTSPDGVATGELDGQ